MTDTAPQGWYADPAGEHQNRWWNGYEWTTHVHDVAPGQSLASETPAKSRATVGKEYGWIVLGGAGALIIGSLLPWATLTAALVGTINVNGTEGDGVLTIVAGGVIALLAFPLVQQRLEKGRVIAALVIAVLAGAVCLYDIINVNRIAGDLEDDGLATADVGFGLYIAGVGAVAASVGCMLALRSGTRLGTRPDPQGPPTVAR